MMYEHALGKTLERRQQMAAPFGECPASCKKSFNYTVRAAMIACIAVL